MNDQFIGMEIKSDIKLGKNSGMYASFCGSVEKIRKDSYKGKMYVVVLNKVVVTGSTISAQECLGRYDRLFGGKAERFLKEYIPSEFITPQTFLVFVPHNIAEKETITKYYIEGNITLSAAQEALLKEKAEKLISGTKEKVVDFVNEFRRTAKNEDLHALARRDPDWGFDRNETGEYHDESEIVRGIFQCDYTSDSKCCEPKGGNTLTLPTDYEMEKKLHRTGARYGLYSVCTFGLDPWPFVVVRIERLLGRAQDSSRFYAIARINGKFFVRKIREAKTHDQYEMLVTLGITELLAKVA